MDWQIILVYAVVVIILFVIIRWIVGIIFHSTRKGKGCPGCSQCSRSNALKEFKQTKK